MSLEFNSVLEKWESKETSRIVVIQTAGNWLKKEIDLLMLRQRVNNETGVSSFKERSVITFLFDKIFTDFTFRWKTPLAKAALLKEISTNPDIQEWFISRLPCLAILPVFSDEISIYSFLNDSQIFPTMFIEELSPELQFPEAFVEEFNNAYVELSEEAKIDNKWLILFVFCLVSFKVLGLEAEFLTKTVNIQL